MSYSHESSQREEVCPALGYQDVSVGVPVEVKPFARIGKIKTECISKPIIERGAKMPEGHPKEVCKFVIIQKLRVEVPVVFGAKVEVGDARINCKHGGCPCEKQKESVTENKCVIDKEDSFRGIIG